MAGFKMRRRLVLAAIETTYGTDAAPTPVANAVLARSVQVTPMAGNDIDRNLLRAYYGNSQSIAGEKHVELQLEVEIAGAGAAGTAPAWGALLRGCGFAETVNAGTDVTYNPVTGGEESISCWIHRDGVLHKFTGGRGTVSFNLDADSVPYMSFKFLGLLGTITNEPIPTNASYAAFMDPLPVTNANTSSLTLHGVALSFSKFSLDMAIDTQKEMLVGEETSIQINDRKPSGTAVIKEPPLATVDLYTKARDASSGAFALVHGKVAGNTIEFAGPNVATGSPTEQDVNGTQMLSVPMTINPDTGNDELVITVK